MTTFLKIYQMKNCKMRQRGSGISVKNFLSVVQRCESPTVDLSESWPWVEKMLKGGVSSILEDMKPYLQSHQVKVNTKEDLLQEKKQENTKPKMHLQGLTFTKRTGQVSTYSNEALSDHTSSLHDVICSVIEAIAELKQFFKKIGMDNLPSDDTEVFSEETIIDLITTMHIDDFQSLLLSAISSACKEEMCTEMATSSASSYTQDSVVAQTKSEDDKVCAGPMSSPVEATADGNGPMITCLEATTDHEGQRAFVLVKDNSSGSKRVILLRETTDEWQSSMKIHILDSKSGTLLTRLEEISPNDSIGDVKVQWGQKALNLHPDRQAYMLEQDGNVLTDEQTLCGLECGGILYFKDLGPPVGCTTVTEKYSKEKGGTAPKQEVASTSGTLSEASGHSVVTPPAPFPVPQEPSVNEDHLQQLMEMGFSREHALNAIQNTSTLEEATEYCLTRPPPLLTAERAEATSITETTTEGKAKEYVEELALD